MDLNSSEDEEQDGPSGVGPLRSSKRRCVQRSSAGRNSTPRYAGRNSVQLVGKRITVFWEYDAKWYSGTIREYSPADDCYLVVYDDCTQSSEDLDDCTWDWEDDRTSGADEVAAEVPTEAGGLKLHQSSSGSTGYLHVYLDHGRFRARITAIEGGGRLGTFDTAVEAAVAVAKKLLEPSQSLVTEAEGLKLHLSSRTNSTTGYRGVSFESFGARNVFRASAGKTRRLGSYKTAVEAAVAVARHLQEEGAGVDEEEEEEEEKEEKELVKEAEGLKLHLSSKSRTGYLHVIDQGSRFRAKATGKFCLGAFASAVEAAVAVARYNLQDRDNGGEEDQAEEVDDDDDDDNDDDDDDDDEGVVTTEAEGLALHLSSQNKTGYLHVTRTGFSRFRAEVRGGTGAPLTLGHYGTAVEAAVAVARHLQAVEEEEEEEEEKEEAEVEVENVEVTEAEQQTPGEQLGQPAEQQPGQQPESPEQPAQTEEEEQPQPQPPSVTLAKLGTAPGSSTLGVAMLSPGHRLAELEICLGTDAPQGANVLQRIIALEANMDVTAIGFRSWLDRIAALEAKAGEWLL
jgi:hypothetical protein